MVGPRTHERAAAIVAACQCGLSVMAVALPTKLIIDTDAGFDVDDVGTFANVACRHANTHCTSEVAKLHTVSQPSHTRTNAFSRTVSVDFRCARMHAGAVCIANALADNGEAEIVAVGHTNGYVKGIGAVSTLMHFYGRGAICASELLATTACTRHLAGSCRLVYSNDAASHAHSFRIPRVGFNVHCAVLTRPSETILGFLWHLLWTCTHPPLLLLTLLILRHGTNSTFRQRAAGGVQGTVGQKSQRREGHRGQIRV